jgi:mannose-6-phosphate isomerase-like protein (cupin superfamily)
VKGSLLAYPEVTIFHTKAGMARGGCVHNLSDEYTCVINGIVEYRVGESTFLLQDGDSMVIPRGMPHYLFSISDSVVLEWGATEEEKKEKHPEFRAMVDEINDPAN